MITNRIRASIATNTALAYGLFGWAIAFETGHGTAGRFVGFGIAYVIGLVAGTWRVWPRRIEQATNTKGTR